VARAAIRGRLSWRVAEVVDAGMENATVRSLRLDVPGWPGHLAGQHVDLRLTAEDGYQAQRSYSIASGPEDDGVVLTVERLDDGEVSPYLVDEVRPGDRIELRGPIGGYFVWQVRDGGPVMLIAGGSGIVPLMAMLRYARHLGRTDLVHLAVSVRSPDELLYSSELDPAEQTIVYTRTTPAGYARPAARIMGADLAPYVRADIDAYVCGSSGFSDAASHLLVDLGVPVHRVRVERFGPTA
jgi:ferredoxin-NADP reductase